MNEYQLIDEHFDKIWHEGLQQLDLDPQYNNDNAVRLDVIQSKCEAILDIVQELMAERDDLQDRIEKADAILRGE